MASFLKLINGVPTSVAPYNESDYFVSIVTANTPIYLPNGGSFQDTSAKDILIIMNKRVVEVTRDFTVNGAGPNYTSIKFIYDLPPFSVINFIKGI